MYKNFEHATDLNFCARFFWTFGYSSAAETRRSQSRRLDSNE